MPVSLLTFAVWYSGVVELYDRENCKYSMSAVSAPLAGKRVYGIWPHCGDIPDVSLAR
jgi:hypothetical protein